MSKRRDLSTNFFSLFSAASCGYGRHRLAAWVVIINEADDESEARTKNVLGGLLGKLLVPWAAAVRSGLTQRQPSVEEKLRERFGDFTPFLDDEDESDPVALEELESERFEDSPPPPATTNPWSAFSEPLFG